MTKEEKTDLMKLYTLSHTLDNKIADELIKINAETRQACYIGDRTKALQIAAHLLKVYRLIKDGILDVKKDYVTTVFLALPDTDELQKLIED